MKLTITIPGVDELSAENVGRAVNLVGFRIITEKYELTPGTGPVLDDANKTIGSWSVA